MTVWKVIKFQDLVWPLNYQALHIRSDADGFYQLSSILGLKEVRLQRLQKVTQNGKLNLKLESIRDRFWCKAERIAFLSWCKAVRIQNSQCRKSSLVLLIYAVTYLLLYEWILQSTTTTSQRWGTDAYFCHQVSCYETRNRSLFTHSKSMLHNSNKLSQGWLHIYRAVLKWELRFCSSLTTRWILKCNN